MSKPKYKNGNLVVVKPNVDHYGGQMGRIIHVIPPFVNSNPVTLYTVEFDDGSMDDFAGWELKPSTQSVDMIFHNSIKETPENSPVVKDVDWSDFKSEADAEWESFVK